MEPDPKIPPKPDTSGTFTPLTHWLGNPSEKKPTDKPKSNASQPLPQSSTSDADCRSTIEVKRVGQTISRIHITCSCGDRHSIELHELPADTEDSAGATEEAPQG